MNAGFTITKQGWRLLAKLVAGATLEISRVMVGSGKLAEGINPGELTDLVQPVALATSTVPQVEDKQVSFIVEYRSDLNGDRRESSEPQSGESGGLAEGFWLNEFGVFANDPDEGEVLLYYATMGDYPQYVSAYNGSSVDIRRYPVSIALSDCEDVQLSYPAGALVTAEEMAAAFAERGVPPGGLEGQMLVKAGAGSATPTKWGLWPSNQTLLDNARWDNKDCIINQRGQDEYTDAGYTIDRWSINNGVVKVMDGYLEITLNGRYSLFKTIPSYSEIGKHYTLSWLIDIMSNGAIYTQIFTDNIVGYNYANTKGLKILSGHGNINSNITSISLVNQETTPITFKLYAAKLEPGDQQTLAHQDADGNLVLNDPPPNKTLELAKCQRYFERLYLPKGFRLSYNKPNSLMANLFYTPKRVTPAITAQPVYVVRTSDNAGVYGNVDIAGTEAFKSPKFISPPGKSECVMNFGDVQVNAVEVGSTAYISDESYIDISADL